MPVMYLSYFLEYGVMVTFVVHTCCGFGVSVMCNNGYISVLLEKWICCIPSFCLRDCNVTTFFGALVSFLCAVWFCSYIGR
jgi:hypothetical protein